MRVMTLLSRSRSNLEFSIKGRYYRERLASIDFVGYLPFEPYVLLRACQFEGHDLSFKVKVKF